MTNLLRYECGSCRLVLILPASEDPTFEGKARFKEGQGPRTWICPDCVVIEQTTLTEPPPVYISHVDGYEVYPSLNDPKIWFCKHDGVVYQGESYYLAWRAARFQTNEAGKAEHMRSYVKP